MLKQIRPALVLLVALTAITGLAYPFAITGLAQLAFPDQAGGSLVRRDGVVVGSALIGQSFTDARYFHGRPSATTEPDPKDPTKTVPVPYAADNSGGSNLGPTNKALIDRVGGDVDRLRAENPDASIPADLVTTSGSGLDPDISPEAAAFQVPRVARARDLPVDRVAEIVRQSVRGPALGIFGGPRVNVLALNMALDSAGRK
ncbi:K(+)-transporting ATPase subunit C [Lichenibacterium dinghuense]|uniref:K(+)-transporting ATPase subunit C n=1 Tax=Lichenibacterium dinghuense TaxID=2895977 RepID=UPI001F2FDEF1|nr:K(+)-transporting ATPase subunit C [Lichenibacterium sp. 6Y81]